MRYVISNPSFEEEHVGWAQGGYYGFQYTTDHASDGMYSIMITDGSATQTWQFPPGYLPNPK